MFRLPCWHVKYVSPETALHCLIVLLLLRRTPSPGALFLASLAAGAVVFYRAGPNTVLIDTFRQISQNYTRGVANTTSEDMRRIVDEVADALGLNREESDRIRIYVNSLTECLSWGTYSSSRWGMVLGYPEYFDRTNEGQINLEHMRLGVLSSAELRDGFLSKKELEGNEAKAFKKSLILSDDEKRFVVARQLLRSKEEIYKWQGWISFLSMAFTYLSCRALNKRHGLLTKPVVARGMVYATIGSVMGLFTLTSGDLLAEGTDLQSDRKASELGSTYAAAGVNYYEKMLRRHVALRSLLQNGQGKNKYTLHGDFFPSLVRCQPTSIIKRRDACRRVKEEIK
jgi:hypothetical protein